MPLATLLAGHEITTARLLGRDELLVGFTSGRPAHAHQLYAGRRLIGSCEAGAREIGAVHEPDGPPEWLAIVAVDPAARLTDHGSLLPPRPYNRVRLSWTATGSPADADRWEIAAGLAPGQPVDPSNVLATVTHRGDGPYEILTPPLPTGTWSLSVTPYDRQGNAGTAVELTAAVRSQPEDLTPAADGSRLTASAAAGLLTIGAAA